MLNPQASEELSADSPGSRGHFCWQLAKAWLPTLSTFTSFSAVLPLALWEDECLVKYTHCSEPVRRFLLAWTEVTCRLFSAEGIASTLMLKILVEKAVCTFALQIKSCMFRLQSSPGVYEAHLLCMPIIEFTDVHLVHVDVSKALMATI